MTKVGGEFESILHHAEKPAHVMREGNIEHSLAQLGHDLSDIKCSLQKKKTKITMVQLNNKLDYIIDILSRAREDA